jgi:hypothetical protein
MEALTAIDGGIPGERKVRSWRVHEEISERVGESTYRRVRIVLSNLYLICVAFYRVGRQQVE